MAIEENTERIVDGSTRFYLASTWRGKTFPMITELTREYLSLPDINVYVWDPEGDIKRALTLLLAIPEEAERISGFCERLRFMDFLNELPKDMGEHVLVLDDGRGHYSLLENEIHFHSTPRALFCTVQITKPIR